MRFTDAPIYQRDAPKDKECPRPRSAVFLEAMTRTETDTFSHPYWYDRARYVYSPQALNVVFSKCSHQIPPPWPISVTYVAPFRTFKLFHILGSIVVSSKRTHLGGNAVFPT